MNIIKPDFCDFFSCTADKCKHSCCKGWEIDIDEAALSFYKSLDHPMRDEILQHVVSSDPACFKLTEDERCPFLRDDGLCRMILTLGEDALCEICAEHPRFYNEYEDAVEAGLGLCCEEAARLLTEHEKKLEFIGDTASSAFLEKKYSFIHELLFSDADIYTVFSSCQVQLPDMKLSEWVNTFQSLERMDNAWNDYINALKSTEFTVSSALMRSDELYRNIASYFVFRHYTDECDGGLEFAMLSAAVISALNVQYGDVSELLRLYSSEIEYSDENKDIIVDEIYNYSV